MSHRSLTFFTAFSVLAHAAVIGLTSPPERVEVPVIESSIEIGLVTLPTIEKEFSHDQARQQQPQVRQERVLTAPTPEPRPIQPSASPALVSAQQPIKMLATRNQPREQAWQKSEPVSQPTAEQQTGASPTVATEAAPRYAKNPAPTYPAKALRHGWEGEVWLKVNISRTGSVESVIIEQSSDYKVLDQAAVRTVRNWTFKPAQIGDQATEGSVRVPINFRIKRT